MNWIVRRSHPHHMCGRITSISEDIHPPTRNCILDIVSPCPSMPFAAPNLIIFVYLGALVKYRMMLDDFFIVSPILKLWLALVIEGFFRDQLQPITKLIVMTMMTWRWWWWRWWCWWWRWFWWWWWWRHSRGRKWRDLSPIHPTSDPPLSPVLPVTPNYLAIKMSILMLLLFLMMIMNLVKTQLGNILLILSACRSSRIACHIFSAVKRIS